MLSQIWILLFFTLFLSISVQAQTKDNEIDWPVKVLIISHVPSLDLTIRRPVQVGTFYTNEKLGQIKAPSSLRVKPTQAGLSLGSREYKIFGVNLTSVDRHQINFILNKHSYRGQIQLIREPDLTISVVNYLSLEEYLASVLPGEIPPNWPEAALQAQAIAARTYALYQSLQRQDRDFHLQADVRSQVYSGAGKEVKSATVVVRATQGQILTYKGYIFPAYYHAACGGRRQDAARLWRINIKPLKGGYCPFCSLSPHQGWRVELNAFQIREKISKMQPIGEIYAVNTIGRDRSGRVNKVKIFHSEGVLSIPAHKFRLAIGPDLIKSTNFNISQRNDQFVFTGYGWGHGVGLCQWGAAEMARQGYTAQQILRFYYPGSRITKMSDYVKIRR